VGEQVHEQRTNVAGEASRPLWEALRVLGCPHARSELATRERAAKVLLDEMKLVAPGIINKAYGRWLREVAHDEVDGVIADAVQAVALAASARRAPFRGQNEAAARAWCRRVLLSHVSNELRTRQARRALHVRDLGVQDAPDSSFLEAAPPSENEEGRLSPSGVARAVAVLRLVREHVVGTHRPRDAESTMRAVWCYLEYLSGATLEQQLGTFGESESAEASGGAGPASVGRARNRVYKLRQRGRTALHAACAHSATSPRAAGHAVVGRGAHRGPRAESACATAGERLSPARIVHTLP
jgi:hypothetical protein